MKRPAFQFYPADWRNNAKLRRCSWAARGVWIELMGLMHDSDEYGVLRWPLKQIAQALGAPVKLLNELVECGVLYGAERGDCEAMIYTPRSGRREGEPVELVPAQAGPIWFSPRMVRDEYVRTVRGEASRFGEDGKPPKNGKKASPKPPIGECIDEAPSRRQGDGSSSSSSSSPSVANATSGGGAADARRRRFEMHEAWQPDEVTLRVHVRTAGIGLDALSPDLIGEFVAFWLTRPDDDTHAGWCRRLVQHAVRTRSRQAAQPAGVSHDATKTRGGAAAGRISLAENIADRSWADGLDPV